METRNAKIQEMRKTERRGRMGVVAMAHTHTHRYAFAVDKFVQKFIMSNANGV